MATLELRRLIAGFIGPFGAGGFAVVTGRLGLDFVTEYPPLTI